MKLIDNCSNCGRCKKHCPYGLDTPALLRRQQAKYFEILAAEGKE
jgi:Fe-S oxidoreductase